jgi:membrane protein implicated in regulation of membrane protease activity
MCHVIFVLPVLGLAVFVFLPFSQAVVLYLPILLGSAIFYWLVWGDMQRPATLGVAGMIGAMAQVIENAAGRVKVHCQGEIWDAICVEPVSRGEKVEITRMERMKLIVRRHANHPVNPSSSGEI